MNHEELYGQHHTPNYSGSITPPSVQYHTAYSYDMVAHARNMRTTCAQQAHNMCTLRHEGNDRTRHVFLPCPAHEGQIHQQRRHSSTEHECSRLRHFTVCSHMKKAIVSDTILPLCPSIVLAPEELQRAHHMCTVSVCASGQLEICWPSIFHDQYVRIPLACLCYAL
jgi:hypothetical protein